MTRRRSRRAGLGLPGGTATPLSLLGRPREFGARVAGRFELTSVKAHREAAIGAYQPDADWLKTLHNRLGSPICDKVEFEALWSNVANLFDGVVGTGHDADPSFAHAIWCSVRHTRATTVVETGVGRGISSRVVLEALPKEGRLWSIDLPLLAREWRQSVGAAVTDELRQRWVYCRGSSRQVLPRLLARVGPLDIFIQDSRGTPRTAGFELRAAWQAIRPGGLIIVSGVDRSLAYRDFLATRDVDFSVVAACRRKSGLFAIAGK